MPVYPSRPAGPARASHCSALCVGCEALIGMPLTASFSPRGAALHLPANAHAQRPYPRTQPPQRPNPHSRALNTHGAASRGFLPRGLCDTCPQVGAARRAVLFAGQVSHNPRQSLTLVAPTSAASSAPALRRRRLHRGHPIPRRKHLGLTLRSEVRSSTQRWRPTISLSQCSSTAVWTCQGRCGLRWHLVTPDFEALTRGPDIVLASKRREECRCLFG